MRIHGICEIILYVYDMAAQVTFYRDVLGLRIITPETTTDWSAVHWVEFDTGACRLCLHSGGMRHLGRDAPKFVLQVDDVPAGVEELRERGVHMLDPFSPVEGVVVSNGHDPEGNVFSLESR